MREIYYIVSLVLCQLLFMFNKCQPYVPILTIEERAQYKAKIKSMFYHSYDSYLEHASGFDELMPISCSGMNTWGTFSLSLIDALDTLAIMGNYSEFRRVAKHLVDTVNFESNTNVSVFETNIRVVGGLLSAHLLSSKVGFEVEEGWPCNGPLLRLAENVARKLLPAFDTPTGMPYGTVNFLHGVPENETPVTCTAGVGTYIVEFGALSRLTGDPIFEQKALAAIENLQSYRSKIGLFGNHINVQNGKWVATESGIGAGVDSYFEYLVKGALLLHMPRLMEIFYYDYELIKSYIMKSDWYVWVGMTSGSVTMPIFQSLETFFPGILTIVGDIEQAKKSLYNYHQIWKSYGFVPEFYDIGNNKPHKRDGYPLRPEFIESVLYLYQATKDPHLLNIGADVVDSIYHSARTDCGFATIKSVFDHSIEDRMESFFLAETLKYLYLLFDEDNFLHNKGTHGTIWKQSSTSKSTMKQSCIIGSGGYVFNTEAHPIDIAALSCCESNTQDISQFKNLKENLNLFNIILPKKMFEYKLDDHLLMQPLYEDNAPSNAVFTNDYNEQNSMNSTVITEISSTIHSSPESNSDGRIPQSIELEDKVELNSQYLNHSDFDLNAYFQELKQFSNQLQNPTESISLEKSGYEHLFCPSQPFFSRLSLQGEIFE